MSELIPIKVKIGLRPNGHADHPDWTKLSMISTDEEVRQYAPQGWIYDKNSGHADARISGDGWDSPVGEQWGCLLATRAFVDEAKAAYPTKVFELTEAEFQDFYDNKAMAHVVDEKFDIQILQGLQIELELREKLGQTFRVNALKTRIAKALDPADPEPGIKKNRHRRWIDFKEDKEIIIK